MKKLSIIVLSLIAIPCGIATVGFLFTCFWFGFAIVVAVAASNRYYQRDGEDWFILAMLISPLLAGLFLVAKGPNPKPRQLYALLRSLENDTA